VTVPSGTRCGGSISGILALEMLKFDYFAQATVTELQSTLVMIRRLVDATKNFQGDDQC
jgi:hypothetical protein